MTKEFDPEHHSDGRLFKSSENSNDLINTPEEVIMEAWIIVDTVTGKGVGPWDSEDDARSRLLNSTEVVVRLTGTYTR